MAVRLRSRVGLSAAPATSTHSIRPIEPAALCRRYRARIRRGLPTGARLHSSACAAFRRGGEGPGDAVGVSAPARLHLTVANDGNLVATGIRLEITSSRDALV